MTFIKRNGYLITQVLYWGGGAIFEVSTLLRAWQDIPKGWNDLFAKEITDEVVLQTIKDFYNRKYDFVFLKDTSTRFFDDTWNNSIFCATIEFMYNEDSSTINVPDVESNSTIEICYDDKIVIAWHDNYTGSNVSGDLVIRVYRVKESDKYYMSFNTNVDE